MNLTGRAPLSDRQLEMQLSLPDDRYRRSVGLVVGTLLGLAFGFVIQFADRIALPGISLYQPPAGTLANTLGLAFAGALLGLMVTWVESGVVAIASTALISVIALLVVNYTGRGDPTVDAAKYLLVSLFLITPLWGLLVPIIATVRWVANHIEEAHRDREPLVRQMWRPALLLAAVVLLGLFLRYPERARLLLRQTDSLIRAGQQADPGALSSSLQGAGVGDFAGRGQGPYQLSWEEKDIERYRIPRPGRNFDLHSVVVARFENGWRLVCLYVAPDEPPICRSMETLPR